VFNIADYLKKFTRIDSDSVAQKDLITSILYEACGATIGFEIKKDILYIKGSPVVKNIVYTKKVAILLAIKEKHPNVRISDIR